MLVQRATSARAVIFDLDGTLTLPSLDFDAIRREIGLPTHPRTPILEAMEQMTPAARAAAEAIVCRHEELAARGSELQDGAAEVLAAIRQRGIPVAVHTRNSRLSAQTVFARHGLEVDWAHAREDGPVKPAPDSVLAICAQFGVSPRDTWVVGDYLFDIQAGQAVGATTVLMIGDLPVPDYAAQANHVIRRLRELLTLLAI
jgi:HAD superfamily hydrolase (TIGR01509 family)